MASTTSGNIRLHLVDGLVLGEKGAMMLLFQARNAAILTWRSFCRGGCLMQLNSSRALCLWMHGAFVGTWTTTSKGDILEYAESWLSSEDACPISLSLPLSSDTLVHRGDTVRFFFENLLPDSDEIRER